MKRTILITTLLIAFGHLLSNNNDRYWETVSPFLKFVKVDENSSRTFVHDPLIYIQSWDTLNPLVFWRSVMNLSGDSAFLNIYQKRTILSKVATEDWNNKSEEEQLSYKDSLISNLNLDSNTRILMTTGKKEFYNFQHCLNSIEMGIGIFNEQCVEPWYAQAILLIESPGQFNGRSPVGALGSFQLMKSVARKFGLTVNRDRDDRQDFGLSAIAASRLINEICIPETKKILDSLNIYYHESDLWFRLLVLHVYHAGAGNVRGVLNHMQPTHGGPSLITTLWQTEYGRFKNASQNYSQVALASILELDKLIANKGNMVLTMDN